MVVGKVSLLVYRCKLKLVWCHLVMAGLERNTELERLVLKVLHKGNYSRWYSTEVVVVELLILRRLVTHQCTTCLYKVGTR